MVTYQLNAITPNGAWEISGLWNPGFEQKLGFFFHRKQCEKNFYYGPIKKEMIHTLMNRHFMCKGEEESVENTRVSNYELMSLS